jgi:hypothetical protein
MVPERWVVWPKWRLLSTWWLMQSLLLLLAMPLTVIYLNLKFEGPVGDELSDGVRGALRALGEREFWMWWSGLSAGLAAAQAVLMWPVRRPMPHWNGQGRSMWTTLALCGLVIGLVWAGAVLAVMDIPWLLDGYDWSVESPDVMWWLVAPPLLGWAVATPLLARFAKGGRREDRLSRIASRLFLGTVIEAIAIVPLDVMVRRKTDCYCGRGTFWAFLVCGTAGFLSMGPAVLLPLLSRRRKRWYAGHCEICGYEKAGLPNAERCPECGAGWRSE